MSRTIDEKVVEMRFDNSDFERNVTQSMSTLDKLKSALDFSGASKAFDGITSAANKVSFDGIKSGLKQLEEEFPILGKIVDGVFLNMGRKIEDFVSNSIKSVTIEPVMEGFNKYASKTSSVQMIMNAIRDGTKSDSELMEEVNGQLERLMWYTDETSYDFAEMTASIGKFTSAGIGLEEAVTAMEGIANLAGISGATKQEANRAMYNISQALSGGFMRLQDWKSIENANMATKEFKEMLIKAAIDRGTLEEAVDEAGNTIWGVSTKSGFNEVNYKTVASTLTEGKWLTNEVLTDTLAMYGAFTDELSKVYDDINENADVTTSQIIKMTNQWKEGTLDMSEAMAMTGKSAEELEAIFASLGRDEYDLGRRAFAAAQEAKTFQEAIDATKDAVSTGWMKTFELLFGNYEEAKVLWTDLANELWDIFAGPISDINDVLTAWRNNDDLGDGRDDLIEGLKNIYRAARSVIDPITEAWNAIFPSATYRDVWDFTHRFKEFTDSLIRSDEQVERIQQTFEGFFRGIDKIKDGVGGLIGAFKEGFESGGGIGGFIDGIAMVANQVGDTIYELTIGMSRVRGVLKDYREGNLMDSGVVDDILEQFPLAARLVDTYENLIKVYDKVSDSFEIVGRTFGKMFDATVYFKDGILSFDSIIDGAVSKWVTLLNGVSELVHLWTGIDLAHTVDNIRGAIFDLADGLKALVHHEGWGQVVEEIKGIGTAFTETFGGIKEFFGPAWQSAVTIFNDWLTGLRTILGGTSGDLDGFFGTITGGLQSVQDFIRNNEGFANFINGIKEGIQFISDFLVKFLSLTDAIEVYQANGGGILGILAVINDKIGIIIDTFADLVQNVTGFDIHGIGDGILSVIQGISYAILQLADTIAKTFGWKDNPFGKLLGQIDSEYTGFDGISVNLVSVFQRIGDAFSKLGEVFTAVSPGISSALSGVKVVLLDVIQFFKDISADMNFPDLLHLIMQVISVFSGIKLAKKAGEMFEAIGDALAAWQKTLKVQMLLELAGAILMIAGAAVLISRIDNDKIGLVIGTLVTAFLGLIGILAVSRAGKAENLKALPGIIISVAAAMVVLSFAADKLADVVAKFGAIENFWDAFGNFAGTLVTISILIGALAGLNARLTAKDGLTNTNAINGIVTAIGKLAVSMLLLAGVIKLYEVMDFWKIAEGLGKIFGTLAAAGASMGVAERLFNFISTFKAGGFTSMESTATSMLKFAGAVAVLAVVAGALTLIDWPDLGNSLLKMIAIVAAFSAAFAAGLVIIGGAMAVLNKLKIVDMLEKIFDVFEKIGDTIWKFVKSIAVLVGITIVIGLIEEIFNVQLKDLVDKGLEFIEYAIHSLSERSATIAHDLAVIIVDIIREALRVLAENIPEITQYLVEILGGLIKGVKDAMEHGDLNIWEVLGGAGLFAGILGLVVFLKKNKVGVRDFGAAVVAIAGAAVLILEMGALFEAIGWLADRMGGAEGLKKMQEFASGIVHVFTDDWGVLALFGVLMAFELLMAKFGQSLFGDKGKGTGAYKNVFKGFGLAAEIIAETVVLIDELGLLFAATGLAIQGVEMIDGVETGGVVKWIQTAGEFYSAIAGIFSEDGGVLALFAIILRLEAVVAKIKVGFGEIAAVSLKVGEIIGLAVVLIDALGVLFAATGALIEGLENGFSDEEGAWKGFGEGKIVDWINTVGDVYEAIGAALGKLIGGLVGGIANGTLKEAADGVTQDMIDLVKGMGEALKALSEAGIIAAAAMWTGGPIGLEAMALEMSHMGPYFVTFANSVSGLSDSTASKALICAQALEAIIGVIPETGGIPAIFKGEKDIKAFGDGLVGLATGVSSYASTLSELSDDDIAKITEKNNNIVAFLTTLKDMTPETNVGLKAFKDGANDLGTFGQTLTSFANSLITYCNILKSDDIDLDVMRDSMVEIKKLTGLATNIGMLGSDKIYLMYTFGNDLYSLGQSIKKYVDVVSKLKVENVGKSIGYTQKIIDMFLGTDNLEFGDKVATLTTEFLDKLSAAFGGSDAKAKADTAADNYIDYFRDRILWDGTIGKISIAMQNMINKSVYDEGLASGLRTGGNDMVTELQDGIVEKFEGEEGLSAKFTSFLESLLTSIATDGQQGTKTRYYNAGSDLIKALKNGMLNEEKIEGLGSPEALQLKDGFKALLDSLIGLIVSKETQERFNRGGASLINSLLSGFISVDLTKTAEDIGGNISKGVGKGMTDNLNAVTTAVDKVVQTTKSAFTSNNTGYAINSPSRLTALYGWYLDGGLADGLEDGIPMVVQAVGSVVDETKEAFTKSAERGGFDIHSNSWLTTLFGRFLDGGLADGLLDGIPGVQAAIDKVKKSITDKMGLNDLMNLLHENGLGALENTFADYVAQFGADFDIEGQMTEFHDQYVSSMEGISIDGAESFMAPLTEGGYAIDGTTVFMDDVTSTIDGYNGIRYDQGTESAYSYFDGIGDSTISAVESIAPTMNTAGEIMGNAVAEPVEERLAEMLTYAEWVAKQYPEGLTKELSAPVFNFDDLYENMKGGQLEAILNMFDAMNDVDRSKLIRAYGLGEEGGNADLANYLQWYWNNEPTRMQNLESIKQATEGYQAYLDEQKALQEAQTIQSQKNYEGVQQIAADMQTQTDEANARHLAYLAEIKMDVAALREELSGVHADIAELNNMDVYIDSSALVGATAEKYNEELGNMAKIGRRRVTR